MESTGQRSFKIPWVIGGLIVAMLLIALIIAPVLPYGVDWDLTYRPAAQAFLMGKNPFDPAISPEAPFFAAPWVLILLAPFALLPVEVGRSILFVIGLIALAYTARKLKASPVSMAFFLISPPILHNLLNGNIEWIPLLGFILPPQIGLFLIAVKPQTGFAVGIYWLAEAWHKGGWKEILRVFTPVTVLLIISFILYGPWPLQVNQVVGIAWFNASLWPTTIPVGLALIVASLKHREVRYAMGASPCLSPYVLFHSWSGAVAALLPAQAELIAAVIGLWILVLIRAGVLHIF